MGLADKYAPRDLRHAKNQLGDQFPDDPALSVFTALYDHNILPTALVTKARELYEQAYWFAQKGSPDDEHTLYWPREEAEQAREAFLEKLGALETRAETGDWPAFCKDIKALYPAANPKEPDEGNVFTDAATALIEEKQQKQQEARPRSRSR